MALEGSKKGFLIIPRITEAAPTIRNKMEAEITITPPPRTIASLPPVKDAMVWLSAPTMNFGNEQLLLVSNEATQAQALFTFPLSIPYGVTVEKITVRMLSWKKIPGGAYALHTITSDWDEYGVTWRNRPAPEGVICSSVVTEGGALSFDVFDTVHPLLLAAQKTVSFALLPEEGTKQTDSFFSRESATTPVLEIVYYDPRTLSFGLSSIPAMATLRSPGNSSIASRAEIKDRRGRTELPAYAEINNPAYVRGEVLITRERIPAQATIRRFEEDVVQATAIIRKKRTEDLYGRVYISKKIIPSRLGIKFRALVPAGATIRRPGESKIFSRAMISRPEVLARVGIKHKTGIPSTATIRTAHTSNVPSVLIISNPEVHGRIGIRYRNDVAATAVIRQPGKSTIQATAAISRREITSTVGIKHQDKIDASATIRTHHESQVQGTIVISNPEVYGVVGIKAHVSVPAQAIIRTHENINATAGIKYRNEMAATAEIMHATRIEATAEIRSPIVFGQIIIRERQDIPSMATIRTRHVSEVEAQVEIIRASRVLATAEIVHRPRGFGFIM